MKSNKVVTATLKGLSVYYTDSKKYFFVEYGEMPQIIERNKTFKNYQDNVVNLNPLQVKLYRRALYGIEALSEKELSTISTLDKLNIKHKQKITQRIINRWKQQITHLKVNSLLTKLFPNSTLVNDIVCDNDSYADDLINHMSFKDLGISHKTLIDKMIQSNCLPSTFYTLK